MSEAEIIEAFRTLDQGHPFWLALKQVLDGDVENEQASTVLPHLTDAARHFNAGRLAHALDLRTALRDLKQARPAPAKPQASA